MYTKFINHTDYWNLMYMFIQDMKHRDKCLSKWADKYIFIKE